MLFVAVSVMAMNCFGAAADSSGIISPDSSYIKINFNGEWSGGMEKFWQNKTDTKGKVGGMVAILFVTKDGRKIKTSGYYNDSVNIDLDLVKAAREYYKGKPKTLTPSDVFKFITKKVASTYLKK